MKNQRLKPKYFKWVYGCLTILKRRGTKDEYYIWYQYNPPQVFGKEVTIEFVKEEIYNNSNTQYQPSILKFIERYEAFIAS